MPRQGPIVGYLLILGGTFLLAFTQVTSVFRDPRRPELGDVSGGTIGDPTWVILSALMLAAGLTTAIGSVTVARGWARVAATAGLAVSTFLLLGLHLTLFINSATIGTEDNLVSQFTASYLFHAGDLYSLLAVFMIFLLTVGLLGAFVASLAYLLAPQRFVRAVWNPKSWPQNESNLVISSLLLVFGLTIFVVYLVRVAAVLQSNPIPQHSFFAQNLPWFYYLQIFFLGLLILTVAARVFLINWGSQTPLDRGTIRDSFDNIGRLERILVGGAVLFDILILLAPAATDASALSHDPVFLVTSRGLAWFLFLLAIPYVPYVIGLHRMRALLGEGQPFVAAPFSQHSLRLVLIHLSGLVLFTALGLGAKWSPLSMMIVFSAWTAGVFLFGSVNLHLDRGLLEPSFRTAASPPLFFAFLVVSLATGLMMWGAGNTYVATYVENSQAITIDNASPYGADILLRLAGAALLSFTVLFALAVAKTSMGVKRSLLLPYISTFTSLIVLGMIVFSVSVWSNQQNLSDAYAGFGFQQYYTEEKLLVAGLVLALSLVIYGSLVRIVGVVLKPRPFATLVPSTPISITQDAPSMTRFSGRKR